MRMKWSVRRRGKIDPLVSASKNIRFPIRSPRGAQGDETGKKPALRRCARVAARHRIYQTGFATSAERAGAWKQLTLLIRRNKGSSARLRCVADHHRTRVWFVINVTRAKKQAEEERNTATHERDRANDTLTELRGTAPTFASQARTLAEAGSLDDAMAKLGYAIKLDPKNPVYQNSSARTCSKRASISLMLRWLTRCPCARSRKPLRARKLALCERLQKENGAASQLRRDLQSQLVDALLREAAPSKPARSPRNSAKVVPPSKPRSARDSRNTPPAR